MSGAGADVGGIDSRLHWHGRVRIMQMAAISFLYHLRPFRERLAVQRLLERYPKTDRSPLPLSVNPAT